jgi:hypothetical protein
MLGVVSLLLVAQVLFHFVRAVSVIAVGISLPYPSDFSMYSDSFVLISYVDRPF